MNTPLLLSDDTILLRAPEPADIDLLLEWENDTTAWRDSSATAPFSRDLMERYVLTYDADIYSSQQLRLVVVEKASGTAVGTVDLTDFDPHNRRAQAGLYIAAHYRRRGYGHHALDLLGTYASEHLGLHQLWAEVAVDNAASVALFRSAGYTTCGRLRSWLRRSTQRYADIYILQRLFT